MNVLIIEDNISTALDIELIFNDLGSYNVKRATSTQEAEKHFNSSRPDLIVSDILLNSKSCLNWLKANAATIPIIIMTNNYSSEYYKDSLELNAHAYLMKPVNAVSLKYEVDRILQNSEESNKSDHQKIIIKDGKKLHLLVPSDIIWVKTEGNYSTIKTSTKKIVIKKSLLKIAEQIESELIFQPHRSAIVALKKIDSIDLKNDSIIMIDGEQIPLSKKLRSGLSKALGDIYNQIS